MSTRYSMTLGSGNNIKNIGEVSVNNGSCTRTISPEETLECPVQRTAFDFPRAQTKPEAGCQILSVCACPVYMATAQG